MGLQAVLSGCPIFTNVVTNGPRLCVDEIIYGDELSENRTRVDGATWEMEPRVDEIHRAQIF